MCGIAGVVDRDHPRDAREASVRRMCDAMLHRGPDDDGLESRHEATIGMRRLAIFDPANGHQPMTTVDGRFTIVFNGAIYNFKELRAELASAGHSFRTNCDTEVLLAAYAEWKGDCLRRLRGMFAFAVWDDTERSLFLARDPFGIKPLYYRQDDSRLIFASEINALVATGLFAPEIDPLSVADYLAWLAVPAPRTIYRNVFSLRPGECAVYQRGRLDIRSTWSFRTIPNLDRPCRSRAEFSRELRTRLDDTIRAHTLADVPVGAFLSGGLDSAVVTGLMTRATGSRLRTFSIGFDEAAFSEATQAEETARHFGTEHHTHIVTGADVARDLEKLVSAFDQPTGDGINTYYVSQAARAGGVTVALSGLGGDELFGGYVSFSQMPRLASWLPLWQAMPQGFRRVVVGRLARGDTRQAKLADFLGHAHDIHELASLQRRVFADRGRRLLLSSGAAAAAEHRSPFHPELAALSPDLATASPLEVISAWELRTYMTDVLLRDSDVMSMRHSLELRVPFVDRHFIEWLWHQPSAYKYGSDQAKSSLVDAVRDVLPPGLINRRKRGFTLPFPLWMRAELRPFLAETFSDASVSHSGLFDRREVQGLWHGFLARSDSREWSRVWSLAVLIAFARRRTTGPTRPATRAPVEIRSARPVTTAPLAADPAKKIPSKKNRRHSTMLLAPELFASSGGITRILQLYLKAISDLAAETDGGVKIVALNDPALDSTDLRRYANNRLDDWLVCSRSKPRFIRGALRMSRGCDRIICGHVAQLPVAWAARRLHPRLRYEVVAHGIEVWRPFSLFERIALRGAERILCVSDYTRRELLRNCPLPDGRAVVLHNALDPFFAIGPGLPRAQCPPAILTVSRLTYDDRYKGVEHLIAAMPAIRAVEPDARLRIIGKGDDLPRLQGIARKLGLLGTGVQFLGFVTDKLMSEEMRSCRLFALPSKKEGFGLVFLEAMAHGRPCLGARAGGIPEVLSEDSGVLVEYGHVPEIAAKCLDALQRDWNEDAILARARHFSYPVFKQQFAQLHPV